MMRQAVGQAASRLQQNLRAIRVRSASPSMRALGGTLAGSAPAFILPFAVAAHFGVGRVTDAYVYALSIATFGLTLSISVLEPNALPLVQAALHLGEPEFRRYAFRMARRASCAVGLAAVPVAAVGVVVALSRGSWTASEQHLAVVLIGIFFALLVTTGASSVLASCLYALDGFALPTLTQGLRSVVPLVIVSFIGRGGGAAIILATSVVCGELLRVAILSTRMHRLTHGLSTAPAPTAKLLSLARAAGPATLGILVVAANPVIDRAVAARFGPGSVTILDLGEKIFYVPTTVIQSSIVLVAGARWARLRAERRGDLREDFYRSLRKTLALAIVLTLVTAVLLLVAPLVITSGLGGVPIREITGVSLFFVIGIPGAGIWMLCARMLVIMQQTRILPFLSFEALGVNVAGDLIGAQLLGIHGIALASAIGATTNAIVGLVTCGILLRRDPESPNWRRLPRVGKGPG